MATLDEVLAPYRVVSGRVGGLFDVPGLTWDNAETEPLEAIFVDDAHAEHVRLHLEMRRDIRARRDRHMATGHTLHRPGPKLAAAMEREIELETCRIADDYNRQMFNVPPAHHGYDKLVELAVMPLPDQPVLGGGDVDAWAEYVNALDVRTHARGLLRHIAEVHYA